MFALLAARSLFKLLVSQLLGVKIGIWGLLWGGHGWSLQLNPSWPDHPETTTDRCGVLFRCLQQVGDQVAERTAFIGGALFKPVHEMPGQRRRYPLRFAP